MAGKTYSELTPFASPWWLRLFGGHGQTAFPAFFFKPAAIKPEHRLEWAVPDDPHGDSIYVDFFGREAASTKNLLVLFHGLEGDSNAPYVRAFAAHAIKAGWPMAVPHFRSCARDKDNRPIPNKAPRFYHNGDSEELDWILRTFRCNYPEHRVHVVGISLGANVLLKWLGEMGKHGGDERGLVQRAAAVSAPIDICASGTALGRRIGLLYTWWFLRTLKPKCYAKLEAFPDRKLYDRERVRKAYTFHSFDNVVTAPLHGFNGVQDYWTRASSAPWLEHIRVPTLMLNARNDPFLPEQDLLKATQKAAPCVVLEFPRTGGHAGFRASGSRGGNAWLPRRVFEFLEK